MNDWTNVSISVSTDSKIVKVHMLVLRAESSNLINFDFYNFYTNIFSPIFFTNRYTVFLPIFRSLYKYNCPWSFYIIHIFSSLHINKDLLHMNPCLNVWSFEPYLPISVVIYYCKVFNFTESFYLDFWPIILENQLLLYIWFFEPNLLITQSVNIFLILSQKLCAKSFWVKYSIYVILSQSCAILLHNCGTC